MLAQLQTVCSPYRAHFPRSAFRVGVLADRNVRCSNNDRSPGMSYRMLADSGTDVGERTRFRFGFSGTMMRACCLGSLCNTGEQMPRRYRREPTEYAQQKHVREEILTVHVEDLVDPALGHRIGIYEKRRRNSSSGNATSTPRSPRSRAAANPRGKPLNRMSPREQICRGKHRIQVFPNNARSHTEHALDLRGIFLRGITTLRVSR